MKFKFFNSKRKPVDRYLAIGFFLFITFAWSYHHYVKTVQGMHYQVFDVKSTISWAETPKGIYRRSAKGDLDSVLLSGDKWREFTLSFDLINPRDIGFVFHYQDGKNFNFVFFNQQSRTILVGQKKDGRPRYVEKITFPLSGEQKCSFKVDKSKAQLFINNRFVAKLPQYFRGGKVGFILKDARDPRTIVHDFRITGRLLNGQPINGQSPAPAIGSGIRYFPALIPFYLVLILFSGWLALLGLKYYKKSQDENSNINIGTVGIIHLVLTVCLFWPFVSRGATLISSYDNFGEIFPLLFLSKHNFAQILNGQSLSLWNPYVHDGIPFFSNHWNMIYYPFNWILFLFSDKNMLTALTLKTFIEVFLTGICAYGFFAIELRSKGWALFCSITYQLCSLLIFTLTVFPSISLYFAMTLYLYLLWSIHKRRTVLNYIFLSLATVLILTSANMAFIFYAVLSLAVISLYRLVSLKKERTRAVILMAVSSLTGFLISAVRILPCLIGIAGSNRIVDNYYTLHDRAAMILRLFLPEMTGWFGPNTFNALTSKNLQLMFEQMDLPSNSQNTFFVYFGILSALLIAASLLVRTKKSHAFWKIYGWGAIAIALLFQPVWGIMSILFFPLNHYSYHTIILPVGLCALAGHTGIYLEKTKFRLEKLKKYFLPVLLFVQCYILVFVTYLFPQITIYTRSLFFLLAGGYGFYFFLKKYYRQKCKIFISLGMNLFNAVIWALLFFTATVILLKPIPKKEWLAAGVVIPFLSLLAVISSALYIYGTRAKKGKAILLRRRHILGFCILVFILSGIMLSSPLFTNLIQAQESYRTYFLDLLLGHIKFFLIAQVGVLGIILARVKLLSRKSVVTLFIIITAVDLLAFNFRFDNVVAPFSQQKAFYQSSFPYQDMNPALREKMDLLNYRTSALDKGGLNSNKSLIFSVPSYTGIIGYMPRRFSNFINSFGYPKGTILLYPADSTNNERFLDLSAVKYVFQDENSFISRSSALSRLNLFYSYEVIEDEQRLLDRLKSNSFNPQKNVLLSRGAPDHSPPLQLNKPATSVPIIQATSDKVSADVKTDSPGVILFNESYDKGWRAYIDNVQVPVINANYNFMACLITAGDHTIRFQYEPQEFYGALRVSTVGIVLLALGILGGLTRKKR